MDLSQLEIFLTIAQEKSFSRAAEKMLRTQPAISIAVKRLEEELGESLFDRSKAGTLTEAGKILLSYAQRMINLRDEAKGAVGELRGKTDPVATAPGTDLANRVDRLKIANRDAASAGKEFLGEQRPGPGDDRRRRERPAHTRQNLIH